MLTTRMITLYFDLFRPGISGVIFKMSPPKRKVEIVDAKTDKKELNKESEDEALGDLDLDR